MFTYFPKENLPGWRQAIGNHISHWELMNRKIQPEASEVNNYPRKQLADSFFKEKGSARLKYIIFETPISTQKILRDLEEFIDFRIPYRFYVKYPKVSHTNNYKGISEMDGLIYNSSYNYVRDFRSSQKSGYQNICFDTDVIPEIKKLLHHSGMELIIEEDEIEEDIALEIFHKFASHRGDINLEGIVEYKI